MQELLGECVPSLQTLPLTVPQLPVLEHKGLTQGLADARTLNFNVARGGFLAQEVDVFNRSGQRSRP